MGLGALQLYVALVHTYGGCRPPPLFKLARMSAREINTLYSCRRVVQHMAGMLLRSDSVLYPLEFFYYPHIIYLCKAAVCAQLSTIYKLCGILETGQ